MDVLTKDIIIVGGGAAGFFAAINIAERLSQHSVCILEKGKHGLQKVKISGGGRCNVTHAEFIPAQLVTNYPRGEKELLGPFHQFMTGDTVSWFQDRGVELKIEDDGRMFPISDSSQTIIDCFLNEAKNNDVDVKYNHSVLSIKPYAEGFEIKTSNSVFNCKHLVIATGSNPKIWKLLKDLGHTINPPVPSLFTFHVDDKRINDIPGVVAKQVHITVPGTSLESDGPLLITHTGLSAPAVLKLSAYGAIEFAKCNYEFKIQINFINHDREETVLELKEVKQTLAKKQVANSPQFNLPKRLWEQLVLAASIGQKERWADINKEQLENLAAQLCEASFLVKGKSTFKEEFVTAGGVELKEVNFKTFESKIIPNLYLAGEVLNIDAVTGGFNFQNAWTGAYIISKSIMI
ncbi:MAG: NAD(P)/FAD-dependent oxidoreductase [Winogradskyella sp.]|nr:NAD(P)/FAD-dependent oxidoreductase [Winogradskyella sp.]